MTKTALITGASGGIGFEFAHIFAQNHYNLVLVARSKDKLSALKADLENKYPVQCQVIPCDLSDIAGVKSLLQQIQDEQTVVEVLVNNAGFGDHGFFTETDWENELEMINLNIISLAFLTKEFAKQMVARKNGKILNVASTAAFLPGPLMSVYYATKAFVLSLTEAVANELGGSGVTVTALCPGPTASGFQSAARIEHTKLLQIMKPVSARSVAEYGYKSLMKGKRVAIPGLINKLQVFLISFTPRNVITAVVRSISANAA